MRVHRNGSGRVRGTSRAASAAAVSEASAVTPTPAYPAMPHWSELIASGQDRCRWALNTMPLTVYVEPFAGQQFSGFGDFDKLDDDTALAQKVLTIANQWALASGGQLSFDLTDDPDGASILLNWTDETTLGRDYEVGHTNRDVKPTKGSATGTITVATITLVIAPRIDAHLFTDTERQTRLEATILHEFGHALGLEHSQYPNAVMFYRGWRNNRLHSDDMNQLKLLYQTTKSLGLG